MVNLCSVILWCCVWRLLLCIGTAAADAFQRRQSGRCCSGSAGIPADLRPAAAQLDLESFILVFKRSSAQNKAESVCALAPRSCRSCRCSCQSRLHWTPGSSPVCSPTMSICSASTWVQLGAHVCRATRMSTSSASMLRKSSCCCARRASSCLILASAAAGLGGGS